MLSLDILDAWAVTETLSRFPKNTLESDFDDLIQFGLVLVELRHRSFNRFRFIVFAPSNHAQKLTGFADQIWPT
jgi:hypothetical protein